MFRRVYRANKSNRYNCRETRVYPAKRLARLFYSRSALMRVRFVSVRIVSTAYRRFDSLGIERAGN